jgi:MYXO-CTERM domain-containing protein
MGDRKLWCALACAMGMTAPARAAVLFENSGLKAGWDSQITQMKGTITEVAMPTFRSPTALRMEQTFVGLGGYHSEVRKHDAQKPGEVIFYGEALYLPPEWKFHPQNVTFEQFARSDEFGTPWILMYVEGDRLKLGGSGPAHGEFGSVAGKAGKWTRIVTRIDAKPAGTMDLWVDGQKTLSLTGNFVPDGQNIRWSVGMYCTRWRAEQPLGLNPMILFHDQMRVTTSYDEADPINWGEGAPGPADGGAPAPADGPLAPDATAVDPAGAPDAAGASDSARAPDAGSVPDLAPARAEARPPAPAGGGEDVPGPVPPPTRASGGCHIGDGAPAGVWLLVLVGLAARRRR